MRKIFFVPACLLLAALALPAQQVEKLAPYYPTPQSVVEKMLELGALKAGEWHFDLGSGDGRVVITAAQKFGAHSVGYEIDDDLYNKSMARITELGLTKLADIVKGDLMKAEGVPAMFAENVSSNALINQVAAEAGVAAIASLYTDALGPPGSDGDSYLKMMRYNVMTITSALSQ